MEIKEENIYEQWVDEIAYQINLGWFDTGEDRANLQTEDGRLNFARKVVAALTGVDNRTQLEKFKAQRNPAEEQAFHEDEESDVLCEQRRKIAKRLGVEEGQLRRSQDGKLWYVSYFDLDGTLSLRFVSATGELCYHNGEFSKIFLPEEVASFELVMSDAETMSKTIITNFPSSLKHRTAPPKNLLET